MVCHFRLLVPHLLAFSRRAALRCLRCLHLSSVALWRRRVMARKFLLSVPGLIGHGADQPAANVDGRLYRTCSLPEITPPKRAKTPCGALLEDSIGSTALAGIAPGRTNTNLEPSPAVRSCLAAAMSMPYRTLGKTRGCLAALAAAIPGLPARLVDPEW